MAKDLKVVLAGDFIKLHEEDEANKSKIVLGPGLHLVHNEIKTYRSGVLKRKETPLTYWVDFTQKKYVPVRGERVVGIVTARMTDSFIVDIGASERASLSHFAFEGATKKNRPNIQIGDVVYCQLLTASKDMEPEVVCVDSYGKSHGLGLLPANGFLFTVQIHVARKILHPDCNLFKSLGSGIPFESAVGLNGRIWVKAKTISNTINVANAISLCEYMTNAEIETMCSKLFQVSRP